MKKLRISLAVLAVVVLIALVATILFFDQLVRKTVETAGPALLGVPVSLEEVRVEVVRGRIVLGGLTIGNPEGYGTPHLIRISRLVIEGTLSSLGKDPIRVSSIEIREPDVCYEKSLRSSNLGVVIDGLEGDNAEPKEDARGPGYVIDECVIDDGVVHFAVTGADGRAITAPLPLIRLVDLGKETDGTTLSEIITEVLSAILQAVADSVGASARDLGRDVKAAGQAAVATGNAAVDSARTSGVAAVESAKGAAAGALDRAQSAGSNILSGVSRAGSSAVGRASSFFSGARNAIRKNDD